MANAASGEPLGYRNGVVLYSAQSTKGTPVTPATAVGNARVYWTQKSGTHRYRGPGSANLTARKGGEAYTEFSLRFPALQSGAKSLLQKATRTGGALPLVTLGLGYQDDQGSPNRSADQIQDCKIGSARLGIDASGGHGPLWCDLSGIGGQIAALTTLAPATNNSAPFMSYEGVFTKAGSAYELRTFELGLEHHLSRDHVIPGAAPAAFQRGFKYLTEHAEVITGKLSRYQRSGVSVQAAAVSTFALQLALTSLDDASTLTLALGGVDFDTETCDEDDNGIFWSVAFEAQTLTIS
jgi:hypothetical protein